MKWTDLVERVRISNTDEDQNTGNSSFDTQDYVYLDSRDEVKNWQANQKAAAITDWALMNGGFHKWDRKAPNGGRCVTSIWLRSAYSRINAHNLNYDGDLNDSNAHRTVLGVCPALHLNLSSFLSARSASRDFGKVGVVKASNGDIISHTIQMGEYPKTRVDSREREKFEQQLKSGKIRKTGKQYSGYRKDDGSFVMHDEYEIGGQKYVRVYTKRAEDGNYYNDGTKMADSGTWEWVKVEPVVWRVRNWDELPTSINPKGNGRAKFIDIRSEEAIMSGIPFYPDYGDDRGRDTMWQNSPIRAFFNGYDLHREIDRGNGNKKYKNEENFNFSGKGLFSEIFDGAELSQTAQNIQEQNEEFEAPNPYGFVYDDLTNDELLKLYIKSNASIFLHGPSGVGKSGRVKQIDPTATRITLRPQMNPEEVDGTLDRETGQYIPPLWYTQLCEKCKAEPDRKHVLFIDELTNVKPTVQSLIYSIVLDRAGKDGLWPLPDNAVVVAAGNESADNLAAYPLTNALFRRFSHIYYEVDKQSWLDWATGISKVTKQEHVEHDKTPRARIHPAIVAFVMSRDDGILNQELDEENPHIVTDPRKWEIASQVLYSTKNPKALAPAIGEELTADFTDFVQNIQLSVEDVVKGRYNERDFVEMAIDRKLSTLLGLVTADEKNLGVVRGFIQEHLGKEILATYDSLWIRNDPERAQIIAETPIQFLDEEAINGKAFE